MPASPPSPPPSSHDEATLVLERAGLPREDAGAWLAGATVMTGDYRRDLAAFSERWSKGAALLAKLPAKLARSTEAAAAATLILTADRASRDRFLATHVETIYRALTQDYRAFLRVEQLVLDAAERLPGLVPSRARLAADNTLPQQQKDGAEIDQGYFLSRVLAHPVAGAHLCHAMLLPHPDTAEHLPRYLKEGRAEFAGASVERRGKAAFVTLSNRRFLNAEDEASLDGFEIAADLAMLDPATDIAVLRGGPVDHPKYQGRRLFSAGINLTHLYHGKISYVWYIKRDMGVVNKLFRGVARPEVSPDEICGDTTEKPWVAAIDGFAIGGGCQLLLATDYVLAASDAYMTLPARKEGIIPGAANLRMWRFTGDRIARQAILYGLRLDCATPEGRLICDEVAPPAELDAAIERVVDGFTSSGVVSAAGNRRALRVAQEPLDLFRRYMAVYAREQAYCHFSPALIANLERNWNAQQRRA